MSGVKAGSYEPGAPEVREPSLKGQGAGAGAALAGGKCLSALVPPPPPPPSAPPDEGP